MSICNNPAGLPPFDPRMELSLTQRVAGRPRLRVGISGNRGGHTRELCVGCALAVRQWQEAGDPQFELELLWEEDAFDEARTRAAAERLVAAGCLAVVGHLSASAALPASRIYHQAGIPFLAPGTTHPELTAQGFWNLLQVCGRDDDLAERLVQAALAGGRRRVALVWQDITYGRTLALLLRRSLGERGVLPAAGFSLADQLSDASAAAMRQSEVVIFAGTYQAGAQLARQARAAGYAGPLLLGDDALIDELPQLAASAIDGALVVSTGTRGEHSDYEPFLRAYVARAGLQPGAYAVTSYEAMRLLLDAIGTLRTEGPVSFMAAARAIAASRDSLLGRLRFNTQGGLDNFPWRTYMIVAGQFIPQTLTVED